MAAVGSFIYWEQNKDFQFTRLVDPGGNADPRLGQPGDHWSKGALPLTLHDWESHRHVLERREPFSEFVLGRRDAQGGTKFFSLAGVPTFDQAGEFTGYRGFATDASQLVEGKLALSLARRSLLALDAPVLWIQANAEQRTPKVVLVNLAGCKLMQRTDSEIYADDLSTLFSSRSIAQFNALLEQRHSDELIVEILPKFGKPIDVAARLDVNVEFGATKGAASQAILVISQPASNSIDDARRALVDPRANAEVESFSFTVSHDLRAPLRTVEGFTRLLHDDYGQSLDSVGRQHLQRISLATAQMNMMIEALLELSRIASQPLVRTPIDLSKIASNVLDDLSAGNPDRKVQHSVRPGMAVWGDPTMLRIALTNLLANAWKFTSKIDQPSVNFDLRQVVGEPVFCIEDNGVGFDSRYADRLFRPFQRLHGAADFPGTGIGLATVKRIVERHGGRVWAESSVGSGSRFFFTLGQRVAMTNH